VVCLDKIPSSRKAVIPDISHLQLIRTLRKGIENNETAGANFLVIKDGEEIFYHEDGFSDKEAGRPITRDTIFRIYSMTDFHAQNEYGCYQGRKA